MGDSYDVEEYIKPNVKRNTYDKSDDHYISEQDEVSEKSESELESEEEIDDSGYKKLNNGEKSEDIGDLKEFPKQQKGAQKEVKKKPSERHSKQAQPEDPVRTSSRLILHVSNLSDETSKQMLESFFGDAGEVKSVRIPKKKRLNVFAFVEMKDIEGYKVDL